MSKRDKEDKEDKEDNNCTSTNKYKMNEDETCDILTTHFKEIGELSDSYLNDIHDDNVHECVVESLEIIKSHIKEKSLRMGQIISYGDIFDFFFK